MTSAPGDTPAPARTSIADAIATHFAGDAALHAAFAASCEKQFESDVRRGDAACATGDLHTLRRLAHDLKSVLLVIGHPDPSESADRMEQRAVGGDGPAVLAHWDELKSGLLHLRMQARQPSAAPASRMPA